MVFVRFFLLEGHNWGPLATLQTVSCS